jgi:hypothetical protein
MQDNVFMRQIYMPRATDSVYFADTAIIQGTTPVLQLLDSSTTVANGDNIGAVAWKNEDDDSTTLHLRGVATEDHASNSAGGSKFEFYVTSNTTSDLALAATIDQDKSLTVEGDLQVNGNDIKDNDGTTCITFDSHGGTIVSDNLTANKRKFTITGNTDGTHDGDVVFIGGTTSMITGRIYHYNSSGNWELANPNAAATSDGLLGVALGAASDTNGVLLRGMVTLDHDPGAVGDVLFLNKDQVADTGGTDRYGAATATSPNGNGDIVRIIGYCLDASNGQIWFNPDNTFVEYSVGD